MALILDTNALSAFVDGDEKLLAAIRQEFDLSIPTVVLGEYLYGINQSRQRVAYQAWLTLHLPVFELLSLGAESAERYAEIRHELRTAGTPIPTNDLWIAAIARQHGLSIVTRDTRFRAVRGLRIIPW